MIVTALFCCASALAESSGTCGINLTWTLDDEATLTITGIGKMTDYTFDNPSPWGTTITQVIIQPGVTSIGNYAFYRCKNLSSVEISTSVKSIGNYAFRFCTGLTNIIIPNSVSIIGSYAFGNCTKMTDITLSSGVSSISANAFQYCAELSRIAIPTSVTSIGSSAFIGCSNLNDIYYNGSEDQWSDIAINESGNDCLISANFFFATICGGKYGDNLNWRLDNEGTLTITGTGRMTDKDSPSMWENNTSIIRVIIDDGVTSIANYAFRNCSNLISVLISDSVTSIYSAAFYGCSSLSSISLPNGISILSDNIFANCVSLTSITIPETVIYIEYEAFANCSNLTNIYIPASIAVIGDNAFYGCDDLTDIYFGGTRNRWERGLYTVASGNDDLKNATIYFTNHGTLGDNLTWSLNDTGVLTISGTGNMRSCAGDWNTAAAPSNAPWGNNITEVVFNEGVNNIGAYAFSDCQSLTNITIPSSVTRIGERAFYSCYGLVSVTIPSSVTNIETEAFFCCDNLREVNYMGSREQWEQISIGRWNDGLRGICFTYNSGICGDNLTWELDNGILTISGAGEMHDFYPPEEMYSVAPWAVDIVNITQVEISNGITSIGCGAFCGCSNMISITIPDSVTKIGPFAFTSCSSLASISIPNSVNYIGYDAFWNCTSLNSISLPDGITIIEDDLFANCSSLTSITIPDTVTSIGAAAFSGCTNLTGIAIPDGVTCILDDAFWDCENLISISIPTSVTCIGCDYRVFRGCISLKDIYYGGTRNQWENITFFDRYNDFKDVAIHFSLPSDDQENDITWTLDDDGTLIISGTGRMQDYLDDSSPFDESSIKRVIINDGVTSIGSLAFRACSKLISVTIPQSVKAIGNGAFYACFNLTNIVVSTDNDYYCSVDGVLYNKNLTELLCYPAGKTAISYSIPESVISIGTAAFACSKLTNITIPDSVTSIGAGAFSECMKLVNVTIPDGVKTIPDYAFDSSYSLVSVIIPDSVTRIGRLAFCGCSCLTSVTIPNSVTSIGEHAFDGCDSLTVYCVSGSVALEYAQTNNIEYVCNGGYCGSNVTWSLDDNGTLIISGTGPMDDFDRDNGERVPATPWGIRPIDIIIQDGVTSIGDSAFAYCKNLTSITIPNSVTSIGNYALEGYNNLISLTIPDSVIEIGICAFADCTKLTEVTLPNGVISIGSAAFDSTNITSMTIPNGVTSIGEGVFACCHNLTSVTIPDSVTSIDSFAFEDCIRLENLTIPDSVTYIGEHAFYDCSSLTSITLPCIIDIDRSAIPSAAQRIIHHKNVTEDTSIDATCEMVGLTAGSHCEACGEIVEEQQEIEALGHDWKTSIYTWSNDNTTVSASHVCSRDASHIETETVNVTTTITLSATCNEMGQTIYTATFSNPAFAVQTKTLTDVPATGHQWGVPTYVWSSDNKSVTARRVCDQDASHVETETVSVLLEISKPATCTGKGQTTYTSATFQNKAFAVQTKTLADVPALGHSIVMDYAVAPTDTEPGLTEGSHCAVCGEILIEQQPVHPLVWNIEKTDGEVSIVKYFGNETNLMIPSTLEGLPVRSIISGAFPSTNCPTRIYIPNSVQSISNTAFGRSTTIYCHEYSEADYWADENDYTAIYTDNTTTGTFYRITMPVSFTMEYGETRNLGAVVWPLVGNDTITVTSSDPAMIKIQGEKLTAVGVGQTTVTLRAGGKSASVVVTVHANPVDFFIEDELGETNDIYYVLTKASKQLSVGGIQPVGAEMSVTWTSANESVAIVSDSGVVTAKRPGQAVITATAQNGLGRSCKIIVCYPVSEISFEQNTYDIPLGGRKQIKALAFTTGGDYVNQLISFKSSDETIATVDQHGIVKALECGSVTITATAANGVTADCTLIIGSAAFDQNIFTLPAHLTAIESGAFANLPAVKVVRITSGVKFIANDAFAGSNVIILAPESCYASEWALNHGMTVIEE